MTMFISGSSTSSGSLGTLNLGSTSPNIDFFAPANDPASIRFTEGGTSLTELTYDGSHLRLKSNYANRDIFLDTPNGDLMIDSTNGNVGINTSSPSTTRRLHIYNTDDTRGIYIENTSATSYAELHLKANREYRIGTGGASSAADAQNNFYVYDNTATAHRFTIDSSGNAGIGNTAPTEKLTVTGNISGSGDLKMSGAISGSQLRASSTTIVEAPYYFQKADGYAITNGNAKTITVSSLAYGAFDLHTGGYGNGQRWNVHVTGGGLMTGGSGPHYDVTVLANQSTSNVTVSLTTNNGSYVIQITNNSGGTMYASYKFCSTNYTSFSHASVAVASV